MRSYRGSVWRSSLSDIGVIQLCSIIWYCLIQISDLIAIFSIVYYSRWSNILKTVIFLAQASVADKGYTVDVLVVRVTGDSNERDLFRK